MTKVVACVIARTVSKRLPKKVFKKVYQQHNMLDYIINRLKNCSKIDEIVLCTSSDSSDDELELTALKNEIPIYRGSKSNVIERMINVGQHYHTDYLIRITGDNVFTSYEYIDTQLQIIENNKLDYVRLHNVPIGTSAEIISYRALLDCYENMDPSISEYLMLYMFNPERYKCGLVVPFKEDYSNYTLTVDTKNDYNRTLEIIDKSNGLDKLNIELKQLLLVAKKNNIRHLIYDSKGEVKYPYGKVISFEEYKLDMKNRIDNSFKFVL
jgi:spore coat polysaccharide biosynthesis protein SpsF